MNADSLIRLLDAGFTREEILQMTQESHGGNQDENANSGNAGSNDENHSDNQEQSDDQDHTSNQEQSDDQNQSADDSGAAFENRLSGIEKRINDLIKTIQSSNVKKDHIDGGPDSLEEQTDKIMASIIRPEIKKKEGM